MGFCFLFLFFKPQFPNFEKKSPAIQKLEICSKPKRNHNTHKDEEKCETEWGWGREKVTSIVVKSR